MPPTPPPARAPGTVTFTLPQAMQQAYAAYQLGDTAEAERLSRLLLDFKPDYFDALYLSAVIAAQAGRAAQAAELLARAVKVNPGSVEAHYYRGGVLGELNRPAEALQCYERAIALKPDHTDAHFNRGVTLAELDRLAEALDSYDRAIALKPDYAEAYNNRGIALDRLGRYVDAVASYERAIALKPDYARAYNNRGVALAGELGLLAEAVASYERAIALKPDYAAAHWNLADCRLMLGDFALGWQEYEWRWKLKQRNSSQRDFRQPLWLGAQPLAGRTILLHSELGLGDTLQFCRYARAVAALGAKVVLEVQPPLLPLLADLEGVAQALPRGAPLPAFDYHCPLMSLPLAFKTDLSSVPLQIPYLRSDAVRVATWREKLGEANRPRVGVVWSGSMSQRLDKRSMALAEMLPLLGEWAEWVSLQKEVRPSDAALLASRTDLRHVGDALQDFADTAALIEVIDVLVTVDTSVAHVAGAMGKPVWILLPFNAHDWRWMLDRDDSIWYPTARLFRQTAVGDWAGVVNRVDEALQRHFASRH